MSPAHACVRACMLKPLIITTSPFTDHASRKRKKAGLEHSINGIKRLSRFFYPRPNQPLVCNNPFLPHLRRLPSNPKGVRPEHLLPLRPSPLSSPGYHPRLPNLKNDAKKAKNNKTNKRAPRKKSLERAIINLLAIILSSSSSSSSS